MAEDWRSDTDREKEAFINWAGAKMADAMKRGSESYPEPVFQGDPLDHAIEEAVDLLFYLYYIKRREDSHATAD